MEGPSVLLLLLLGIVSSSHNRTSMQLSEVRVRPGENITLYCDCKLSTGKYTVWFRNCSHENQPSLVLRLMDLAKRKYSMEPLRFELVKNFTSDSYDLLIMNVTATDEGIYYCGTEQTEVKDEEQMRSTYIYTYGSITTRLIADPQRLLPDQSRTQQNCDVCWKLFYFLCPTVSVLSAFLSSLLVYLLCQKTAVKTPQDDVKTCFTKNKSGAAQDEDVCYAALEVHQASHKPKRKRPAQRSDFSTYSTIKTSQV